MAALRIGCFAEVNRSRDTGNCRGVSKGKTHSKGTSDGEVPRILATIDALEDPRIQSVLCLGSSQRSVGSRGIKRPSSLESSTQICFVVGCRVNDVLGQVVASDPSTATPAGHPSPVGVLG